MGSAAGGAPGGGGGGAGAWSELLERCEARARADAERLRASRGRGRGRGGGGGEDGDRGGDRGWGDPAAVPRVAASELSVVEMRTQYVDRGRPVIVTGLGDALTAGCADPWVLLRDRFGHKTVAVYQQSEASARGNTLGEPHLMQLDSFLDLLAAGDAQGMYLYDTPLASKLPELLEHWRVPRYFSHCFLQKTRLPHAYLRSWPTAFVGARGTTSPVHVDRWHSHFWMVQVAGRKRWTIWPESDMPLLRPSWARGTLDPEFPAFGELLQCPDAGLTRPVEAVVEAGEVLFVPGGCPHRVENLAESISFAGNFVDDSNLEAVLADQCALAHRYPEAGELHAALDEVDWSDEWRGPDTPLPPDEMAVDYFQGFANRAFS